MEKLNQKQVELVIETMAQTAIANESYFSELDGVMGDGDFGASLTGGYNAILAKWNELNRTDIGAFLLNVATVWTSSAGGCSGPVWGTLFMRCGMAFKGKTEVSLSEIIPAFENAMNGIMQRGGAKLGDKTMLDAMNAMVASWKVSAEKGDDLTTSLDKAADAAVEIKETTKEWVAMRGRQSFTGDRSVGTYDPGIVAVGVFARAICAALT